MQPVILAVVVSDGADAADAPTEVQPVAALVIADSVMPSIEVELVGGCASAAMSNPRPSAD
ncbi:MAG: hypothetical protein DI629_14390 [Mesorhizobium amorphae]|nr:MAG: hypothetical protein DI629_14390 [Mesorhizobium amorphae]